MNDKRSSVYFCRVGKKKGDKEQNGVKSLLIDNQGCTDPDKISKHSKSALNCGLPLPLRGWHFL